MRGLNLSRLARASESSFFKHEQASQTAKLRERLAESAPNSVKISSSSTSLNSADSNAASTDVLMEIAAHRAYVKLAQNAPKMRVIKVGVRPLRGTTGTKTPSLLTSGAKQNSMTPDAHVLRALGPARLAVYEQLSRNGSHVRALPGSVNYSEGAALGVMSFGVATMVVASVGVAGGVVLHTRPGIIESWRAKTVTCRDHLDTTVGVKLRRFSKNMSQKVLTDEQRNRASMLARGVVKQSSRAENDGSARQQD